MARHVSVAPATVAHGDERRSSTSTFQPATRRAVALAMAQVILSERSGAPADAGALRVSLAACDSGTARRRPVASSADEIRKVAREFASASPSLAVAGGVGASIAAPIELCAAVNILNYVAGNVGKTVQFGADPGSRATATAPLAQLVDGMGSGRVPGGPRARGQPGLRHAQERRVRRAVRQGAVQGLDRAMFRDDTAAALRPDPARIYHALERWDDSAPRAGVAGLMQPVMRAGLRRPHATGDVLLKASQKARGSAGGVQRRRLRGIPQGQGWAAFAKAAGATPTRGVLARGARRGRESSPPRRRQRQGSPPAPRRPPGRPAGFRRRRASFVLCRLSDFDAVRRPRRQQAVAPRESPIRSPRSPGSPGSRCTPTPAAQLDVRDGEIVELTSPHGTIEAPVYVYPGVRPDGRDAARPGHTPSTADSPRSRGVNALDLLGGQATDGFLPYSATRVTLAQDRRLSTSWPGPRATPRQLGRGIVRGDAAGQAAQGD